MKSNRFADHRIGELLFACDPGARAITVIEAHRSFTRECSSRAFSLKKELGPSRPMGNRTDLPARVDLKNLNLE